MKTHKKQPVRRPHQAESCIRRATINDRKNLLDLLNHSFTPPGSPLRDFRKEMPYLFTDKRMGDHFVYEDKNRIVGCIGLYPFKVTIYGTSFHAAGIGQVATHPEMRGMGIMSALLEKACGVADRFDFTWLFGDRQRYGRYGWASGGTRAYFETFDKYLPEAPAVNGVQPLSFPRDSNAILRRLYKMNGCVHMNHDEFALFVRSRGIGGWKINNSIILTQEKGQLVWFADGAEKDIAALLSHQARLVRKLPDNRRKLRITCPFVPSVLLRICQRYFWHFSLGPSACYRVGNLHSFVEKTCRIVRTPAPKSGALTLFNTTTGKHVSIINKKGALSATETMCQRSVRLTTLQLSELFFAPFPLENTLSGNVADEGFLTFFPSPISVCGSFSL